MTASGLYVGRVSHVRLRPRRHALRYRVFMLLLDLDELATLASRLRLFSLGRFNLLSFNARDHGDRSGLGLRAQVETHLAAAGVDIDGGAIRLLCLPRVLGYAFNPLSIYFCHRPDGALAAMIYEVSSTFGERHSYLIEARPDARGVVRQAAAKRLHVSPFMAMDLTYAFRIRPPSDVAGSALTVAVDTADGDGSLLFANFTARRRPLTDAALAGAWLSHPLVTLKVIAAIHWEGLKIALKGVRLRGGPDAPSHPVSQGSPV